MIKDAYIVSCTRTPVGKSGGEFKSVRPDDLLSFNLAKLLKKVPNLSPASIDDVIIGCAMPEAEQGLNVARMAALLAGYPTSVPGVTINRFCASGLQSIAFASDKIRLGEAEVIVAGGVESMSMLPVTGHHPAFNPRVFEDDNIGIAYGMGITAEEVATRYKITREAQDAFALRSHENAIRAIDAGYFAEEISPYQIHVNRLNNYSKIYTCQKIIERDEGVRYDTNMNKLSQLKPAFKIDGSVTAGNSSQMSDGASTILICSEDALRKYDLKPMAKFVGYAVSGVDPKIMGIGPVLAIPKVLKQCGIKLSEIEHLELNEAFAAQSLAIIQELDLNIDIVNPLGGAIALGHPLGATGSIRTTTLLHSLKRTGSRYGMVSMCVGTGMGAAAIFENI